MLALNRETHIYTNDGRIIPHSVSSALADAGLIDGRFFTEEGRINGTRRHLACQYDEENDLVEASVAPEDRPFLDAWRSFKQHAGWVSACIEQPIYSKDLDCAGCPDDVGYFLGDSYYTVLDWKMGAEGAAKVQTAGYVVIFNDHHRAGLKIPLMACPNTGLVYIRTPQAIGRCALLLRPDGTFRYQKYAVADLRRDTNKFLWAVSEAKKKEPRQ